VLRILIVEVGSVISRCLSNQQSSNGHSQRFLRCASVARENRGCPPLDLRLRQDPWHRPLVATAIVAAIGNGAACHKGRELAAWLGLAPKQHSTGGKAKLYGIRRRGNNSLSKILIHGARAVVLRSKRGNRDGCMDDLA
jgi:transposase